MSKIKEVNVGEEYDKKALGRWGDNQKSIFLWLVESYGIDTNGYDGKKSPGERCAWTCYWATQEMGVIGPDRYLPVECMTIEMLFHELQDIMVIATGTASQEASSLVLRYYENKDELDIITWASKAKNIIGDARKTYKEYIFRGNPPDVIKMKILRKGWDDPATIPNQPARSSVKSARR